MTCRGASNGLVKRKSAILGTFKNRLFLIANVSQFYLDTWESGYNGLGLILSDGQGDLGIYPYLSFVTGLGLF